MFIRRILSGRLAQNECGATVVEYSALVGLISAVVIIAFFAIGEGMRADWDDTNGGFKDGPIDPPKRGGGSSSGGGSSGGGGSWVNDPDVDYELPEAGGNDPDCGEGNEGGSESGGDSCSGADEDEDDESGGSASNNPPQ